MADKNNLSVVLPVLGTIIVAILGGVFSILTFVSQKKAETKQKTTEFKVKLIDKIIKENTREKSIENIEFFIDAGLIEDEEGKLKSVLENQENIPSYFTIPEFFKGFSIVYPKNNETKNLGTIVIGGGFTGYLDSHIYQLWIVAEGDDGKIIAKEPALISTSHKWKAKINIEKAGKYTLVAYLTMKNNVNTLGKEITGNKAIMDHENLWVVDFVSIAVK
ncbi:MAG: hypothetical protein ABFR62_03780 [Bacteroidota bacterium]